VVILVRVLEQFLFVERFLALGCVVFVAKVEAGREPVADAAHFQAEDQPGGARDDPLCPRVQQVAQGAQRVPDGVGQLFPIDGAHDPLPRPRGDGRGRSRCRGKGRHDAPRVM
jgi:hypothetical protein